jgi:hypothetical protein
VATVAADLIAIAGVRRLLEIWLRAQDRGAWQQIVDDTGPESQAGLTAAGQLGALPSPLDSLYAAAELARTVDASRAADVLAAREQGATWDDVAAAMGVEPWQAAETYRAAIADLPETERARAEAVLPVLDTDPDPLSDVARAVTEAHRMEAVARRLRHDHPGLPLFSMYPDVDVRESGDARELTLHIYAPAPADAPAGDGVRPWAQTLGTDVTEEIVETSLPDRFLPDRVYTARAVVDGVALRFWEAHRLTEAEAEAWRAQQETGPDGGEGRG